MYFWLKRLTLCLRLLFSNRHSRYSPPIKCSINAYCTTFESNYFIMLNQGSSCKNSLSYLVAPRPQYLYINIYIYLQTCAWYISNSLVYTHNMYIYIIYEYTFLQFVCLYPINVKTAELIGPNIFCFCYNVYKDSMFMVEIKDGRETPIGPRIYISTNPPPLKNYHMWLQHLVGISFYNWFNVN